MTVSDETPVARQIGKNRNEKNTQILRNHLKEK